MIPEDDTHSPPLGVPRYVTSPGSPKPYSPADIEEIRAKGTAEDLATANRLIPEINKQLERGNVVHVKGLTSPLARAIQTVYVGWRVQYKDSQRDGPWLEFTPEDHHSDK